MLVRLGTDPVLGDQFASRRREMGFGDQRWHSIARKTIASYRKVLTGHSNSA